MVPEAHSTREQLGSEMNEEQRTQTQPQAPTPSQTIERVVIHHLSDLRYQDNSGQRDTLFRYRGYLDTLPSDRQPNVVVITGDLTESGKQHDLRAVANFLAACFPNWEGKLHEHIFVLPGVRDVNWESIGGIGWKAFLESFKEFALPAYGKPNPGGRESGVIADKYAGYPICTCYQPTELSSRLKKEIAAYEANYTKFTHLRDQLKPQSAGLRWPFARNRKSDAVPPEQVSLKTRTELDNARAMFLQVTEDYQPLALASGRVLKRDLEQFETWSKALAATTLKDPLKILITHHPLAIDMDQPNERAQTRPEEQSFKELAHKASHAGFYLALHGHAHQHDHNPKALTGFSILGGATGGYPLRQIGAASLCDTGTFNEIIAERRNLPVDTMSKQTQNGQTQNGQTTNPPPTEQETQGNWRFELRLIDVDIKGEEAKRPFLLLNPEESAERLRERLESAAQRRQMFDARMQVAMGQFSERVQQSFLDKQQDRPNAAYLPQSAMQVIEAIIRDIIFSGCAVRVRVLLKDDSEHRPFPKLTAAYLAPPIFEGPDMLVYPASVAAWSLVLGRTLCYSATTNTVSANKGSVNKDGANKGSANKGSANKESDTANSAGADNTTKDNTTKDNTNKDSVNNESAGKGSVDNESDSKGWSTDAEDYEWLRATNKLTPLRQALEALNQELFARSVPNEKMQDQYKNLLGPIRQLEAGAKEASILGKYIYQESFDSGRQHNYPNFICVPYPRRPRGGSLPGVPETMVLDVGVRPIETSNTDKGKLEEVFTTERVAMLESITELIGMMLTTANALGKPRGLWDARVRG